MEVWFVFRPEYQREPQCPGIAGFMCIDRKPQSKTSTLCLAFPAHLHSRSCEESTQYRPLGYEMVLTKSLNTISQRSPGKKARTRRRKGVHYRVQLKNQKGREREREALNERKKCFKNYLLQYLIHRIQKWTNLSVASEGENWFWDMVIMRLLLKLVKYSIELRNTRGWEVLLAKELIHLSWRAHSTQEKRWLTKQPMTASS